jgi:hypothetical protein
MKASAAVLVIAGMLNVAALPARAQVVDHSYNYQPGTIMYECKIRGYTERTPEWKQCLEYYHYFNMLRAQGYGPEICRNTSLTPEDFRVCYYRQAEASQNGLQQPAAVNAGSVIETLAKSAIGAAIIGVAMRPIPVGITSCTTIGYMTNCISR